LLECKVYYDSTRQGAPTPAAIDLSVDAAAAARLARLGLSSADLPAALLSESGGKLRVLGIRLTPDEIARLCAGSGIGGGELTVYSTTWCPDCRRAKRVLDEAAVSFGEVDIDEDETAEALVLARSGGRRVVPTLRLGDRVWAFNPDPLLLRRLLEESA
jgi:mycoredoxin